MSDLVGNPEDRFSQNEAHITPLVAANRSWESFLKYDDAQKTHYENIPMQYTAIFHSCKNDNFRLKYFDYFHFFAQNIDCGYTLEPPH